jgi:hypothetical protein
MAGPLTPVVDGRLPHAPQFNAKGHQTPYIEESPDVVLSRVLAEEWPHEELLASLPK